MQNEAIREGLLDTACMPSQDLFLSILSQSASHATARQLPLFLALTPLSTPGEGSNEFMAEETRSFAALLPFVRASVRPGSTPAWHQPHALHSPLISLVVDPVGNILDVIGTQLVTKGRHRSISVGDLPRLDHSLRAPSTAVCLDIFRSLVLMLTSQVT